MKGGNYEKTYSSLEATKMKLTVPKPLKLKPEGTFVMTFEIVEPSDKPKEDEVKKVSAKPSSAIKRPSTAVGADSKKPEEKKPDLTADPNDPISNCLLARMNAGNLESVITTADAIRKKIAVPKLPLLKSSGPPQIAFEQ